MAEGRLNNYIFQVVFEPGKVLARDVVQQI